MWAALARRAGARLAAAGASAPLARPPTRALALPLIRSPTQALALPLVRHPAPAAIVGAGNALLVARRGFYFPRRRWYPWRARIAQKRQAAHRKKRHIWPRIVNPDEAPIFQGKDEGVLKFRDSDLIIGLRRLTTYAKLIRGRHLQDAIDWIESLTRLQTKPILQLLRKALTECTEKHGKDPARMYVFNAHPLPGTYVRSVRRHIQGRYGIAKSPRHKFEVQVREMPLEEYFHRLYICGRVPKSLAADMRLAIHEHRVSGQMMKEWSPYLCANSRYFHRKELKWLDSTRQFEYYEARRLWIDRYRAQQLRASMEAREARGLPALPPEA